MSNPCDREKIETCVITHQLRQFPVADWNFGADEVQSSGAKKSRVGGRGASGRLLSVVGGCDTSSGADVWSTRT